MPNVRGVAVGVKTYLWTNLIHFDNSYCANAHLFLARSPKVLSYICSPYSQTMDDKAIIARINALFYKSGMTQQEAADSIGLCRNAFCNLIYGKTKNFYKHIPALAKLFGVTEDYLTGFSEETHAGGRLEEPDNFKEQRDRLVREYEDRIEALQSQIRRMDDELTVRKGYIDTLTKLCSKLEHDLAQK